MVFDRRGPDHQPGWPGLEEPKEPKHRSGLSQWFHRTRLRARADRALTSGDEDFWRRVLRNYSARDLTNANDRLNAISSIIQVYGLQINDRCFAGIWGKMMPRALLWKALPLGLFRLRPESTSAPSWSWASIVGAIKYPDDVNKADGIQDDSQCHGKVVSCEVVPLRPQAEFGAVHHAALTFRGRLKRAFWKLNFHGGGVALGLAALATEPEVDLPTGSPGIARCALDTGLPPADLAELAESGWTLSYLYWKPTDDLEPGQHYHPQTYLEVPTPDESDETRRSVFIGQFFFDAYEPELRRATQTASSVSHPGRPVFLLPIVSKYSDNSNIAGGRLRSLSMRLRDAMDNLIGDKEDLIVKALMYAPETEGLVLLPNPDGTFRRVGFFFHHIFHGARNEWSEDFGVQAYLDQHHWLQDGPQQDVVLV